MMTNPDETSLTFHARLYAIMRWERRCAEANLQQVARHGDRWLQEELARVAQAMPGDTTRGRPASRRPTAMRARGGR